MARKKSGKHSKTPAATSATARRSSIALGAATAVVGASLALGVTPAFAQTGAAGAPAQPAGSAAQSGANNNQKPADNKKDAGKPADKKQVETKNNKKLGAKAAETEQGVSSTKPAAGNNAAASNGSVTPAPKTVQGKDREASPAPAPKPQANSTIELSKKKKDTLPNMYAWGKSDNVYSKDGQGQEVTFKLNPADGIAVTKVAIFPNDNIDINGENAKKYIEYRSDKAGNQPYSGTYSLTTNGDGSAILKMSSLFRDGKLDSGAAYVANRCIYVYGTDKDGKDVLLYKTNIARAATIIPPKKTGSIVLKYNEELTDEQIRAKLKQALDAPTEAKDKKTSQPLSVKDQITAASQAFGVGVRDENDKRKLDTTPDDPEKKVVITDNRAYLPTELDRINKVTSPADAKEKTYVTGVNNLKTYLVSDLGYKSEPLALTVARYDTRIDKPVVTDPNNISNEVQKEIAKKLANLNHIPQDKVTINTDGTVTINFEGVDPSLAPNIKLSDLVLKQLNEADVKVPSDAEDSKVKAVVVANPLGYSNAELDQIKQAIYEANKDNQKLGLTSKDQISLGWISGNLTQTGDTTKGISNGQSENTITVTIKTDKAYAQFKSDIKEHKLTRLVNLRTDYKLSWEANKNKIDGRTSDEGLAWMEDGKTLVYRYDSDSGTTFNTEDVLKLLKATLKDDLKKDNPQMRTEILGSEYKTVAREGINGKETRSHAGYAIDDKGNPIGVLNLTKLNGSSYGGFAKPVDNSDKKMGDEQSSVNKFTFDTESKAAEVAGKSGKCMIGRLFIEPYTQYQYNYVYGEGKYNPRTSPKGINVVFVPQTKHKTKDLSKSIGEHKLADDQKTPTEAKYYNASDAKKKAYDDALKEANEALKEAGNTEDSKLSEDLKARIDNATINLNKARAELDGPDTNKDKLSDSIKANGTPAKEGAAATGTQATNQFKNVTDPDFKKADGSADTERNEAAKKAKTAYDDALAEANKVKDDENATQKAVDAAKANLDAARAKLNDFTTNKDELSAAIAKDGKVNTGKNDQGTQDITKADPTYQNSSETERKAYDDAVAEAQKVVADPNASQKEVNEAIKKLKDAKSKLDAKATDKSKLAAAEKQSFDNPKPDDTSKQSVFYKNALNKKDNGASEQEKQAAEQAIKNYDQALTNARAILNNEKATQAQVDEAKKKLEEAEKALHENYKSDDNDLTKAIANNVSGYLMPAYFNAFDQAQKDGADSQAAKDFKAYNDAYQQAKALSKKLKETEESKKPKQTEIDAAKTALEEARKVIDKYATDTSKISAALLHSLAIINSPAYKNASANSDPNSDEAKAKKAYDDALKELQKAFNDQMDKDKGDDGNEIPESVIPDKNIDMTNADALKKLQAHAKGQPLNRDVTKLLAKLNDAVKGLDKFKTNTDELIKSINEDATTHPSPAFKNASVHQYLGNDGAPDVAKNTAARKAASDYGEALNKAKDLLNNPNATQKDINDAKTALDNARKELDKYNTDTTKLTASVEKHGKDAEGANPAVEGTKDSDAYRNASDPHFMKEEGGKLVPDDDKNKKAAEDKKAYDEALTKAQELLKKHNDKDTPQDAKPTQAEIDAALKTLEEKRQALDTYKTDTTALTTEAEKSQADAEGSAATGKFEDTPEFKNASYKQNVKPDTDPDVQQAKSDIDAYKKALKDARDLLAKKDAAKLSNRPTQQEVDDALDALTAAKKKITDNYKTNLEPLTSAKDFANGDFKKTPEYKNAAALKDNQEADADKKEAAKKAVEALDDTVNDSALKKAKDIIDNPTGKTQKEVDDALEALKKAMDKVTENYKTNADKLKNEVGDKDEQGKDVTPPFEATVEYKNALTKKDAESEADAKKDTSATKKLEDYEKKLKTAQDLIAQVNSTDPNADPDKKPTQAQVDKALQELKDAKTAIDNAFKTNAKDLKTETKELKDDGQPKEEKDKFEKSTEYKNALARTDADSKKDVQTYQAALEKANKLLGKFDENGQPKSGEKDIPTQQEVDAAKNALKEIKDKILANYKTSSTPLQMEVDKSKDGKDDPRDDVFENTPAFKNADAAKDGSDDNADMKAYKEALKKAKEMLDKFDRATGQPKKDAKDIPTQAKLDEALKALQDAKAKIEKDYPTNKEDLTEDYDNRNKEQTSDYSMASKDKQKAYSDALNKAKDVLNNPNASQAEVDAAQKALKDALEALVKSANANRRALYEDMVIDARNALQKLVDANEATHLKDLYTHAEPAAQHEFMAAMDHAKKVLADKEALASELDAARVRLLRALDGLAQHQLPGMTNAGAGAGANGNAGANGAAGYGAHAASAYGRGAHAAGRVRAHAGKHLAQTSDPTNALAAAGMLASALGFIAMGFKTKKRRAK